MFVQWWLSAPGGLQYDASPGRHERTTIMDALRSVLIRLQQQGAALGHFNVADLVLLKAVLVAAIEVRVPVIVCAPEGERDFLGTYELATLVKSMREEHGVPVFLNADHTHSLAKAVPYKILPAVP